MVKHAMPRGRQAGALVITPPSRIAFPNLGAMWEAREVLLRFGARDITLRYRQTALGVIWVILQPLMAAGVMSIIFGQVAKLPTGGIPPFLFTYSGMLAWNLFSGVVTRGSPSLVANAALVSKVFFPRVLVPLSVIYSLLVDFVVALVFLGVLLALYGVNPGWGIVALPLWVLLACMMGAGIALILAPMTVRYRDVQYILPVLLSLAQYASPIAYSVPDKYRIFFEANPVTWLLECFRWSTLRQHFPPTWHLVGLVVVASVLLFVGAMVFEKMERTLADVI